MGRRSRYTGNEVPISQILGKHRPPGHTEETAMHHSISYHMAQARIARLRHHAQRDALAGTTRRLGQRHRPGLRLRALRRTWAVPGTAQAVQPAAAGETPTR